MQSQCQSQCQRKRQTQRFRFGFGLDTEIRSRFLCQYEKAGFEKLIYVQRLVVSFKSKSFCRRLQNVY